MHFKSLLTSIQREQYFIDLLLLGCHSIDIPKCIYDDDMYDVYMNKNT